MDSAPVVTSVGQKPRHQFCHLDACGKFQASSEIWKEGGNKLFVNRYPKNIDLKDGTSKSTQSYSHMVRHMMKITQDDQLKGLSQQSFPYLKSRNAANSSFKVIL